MLNENAKKWVAALRSGEFIQGTGVLFDGNRYCCLGVACVVAERNGIALHRRDSDVCVEFDGENNVLPKSVQEWIGLKSEGGQYHDGTLWRDNDIHCKSLSQIADIIESEPEGLFVKDQP